MSRIFDVSDEIYAAAHQALSPDQVKRQLITVRSHTHVGSLLWFSEYALPVWEPGLSLGEDVVYSDGGKHPVFNRVKHLDGMRAQMGLRSLRTREIHKKKPEIILKLIPTTVCAMTCRYCYAGSHEEYEKVNLDFKAIEKFLVEHGEKLVQIIVYGGDSLMVPGLAKMINNTVPRRCQVNFVTGMGYPTPVFEKKFKEALDNRVYFTFSIDPPCGDQPYTRVYKLYPGDNGHDWYREMMRRLGTVQEYARDLPGGQLRWGVRPTATQHGYNHRQLREDILEATGVVPHINMEPASGGLEPGGADEMEMLRRIDGLLDKDVHEIIDGKLALQTCQYFRDKAMAMMNPGLMFSPGGCYEFFEHLSIGPKGELSFCNEAPTYDEKERDGWLFGHMDAMDSGQYGSTMEQMFGRPPKCRNCDHRHTCGTHCPIKIFKDIDDGCMFSRIIGEKVLKILASVDNPDAYTQTLDFRIRNLEKWHDAPLLTSQEIKEHADWMMA